jgi:23S rRNA pseudouridine1911/1915/1917 synthase
MVDTAQITVAPTQVGMRLDKLLADAMPDLSRSRLKALIKDGHILSASKAVSSPSYKVKADQTFTVVIPEPEDALPVAEDIPLDVVFEDENLIVVNKPAGMVVHPAPGLYTGTLVNALLHHCGDSLSGIGGVKRPGIVHRIDKDTSGLLVMAKNDKTHNGLAEQFADHSTERTYVAVCKGHPRPLAGRIEGNIGRHPVDRKRMAVVEHGGKHAVTHYKTVTSYAQAGTPLAAQIECKLETGRTHQIRVHMAQGGNPLLGDPVYARNSKVSGRIKGNARAALQSFSRQALHAKSLGFMHPILKTPFKFECDLPYDIKQLLEALDPYRV